MPKTTDTPPVRELAAMYHQMGCPGGRVEEFTNSNAAGTLFRITRCQECGGQRVQEVNRGA